MMNPILSQAGPDQLIPSESFRTWDQDGAVKIRKCAEFDIAPMSLVSLIDVTCRKAGAASTAFKYKVNPTDPRWTNVTYEDYHKNIQAVARAFVKLGLEPLRSVAILGFNSPEWFLSEMGAIYAGGMVNCASFLISTFTYIEELSVSVSGIVSYQQPGNK